MSMFATGNSSAKYAQDFLRQQQLVARVDSLVCVQRCHLFPSEHVSRSVFLFRRSLLYPQNSRRSRGPSPSMSAEAGTPRCAAHCACDGLLAADCRVESHRAIGAVHHEDAFGVRQQRIRDDTLA